MTHTALLVGLFLLLHSAIRDATHTPVLVLAVVTLLVVVTTAVIAKKVRLT